MRIVRRIFRLIAGGASLHSVQDTLEQDGVPAPSGGRSWSGTTIRNMVSDDCYRPHATDEIAQFMRPDVVANPNLKELYGIS
jgi:hypothetical protein